MTEFVVNNKIHLVTKISPFIANYRSKLKIGADIRKEKVEKATKFVERIKKMQKEAGAALKKIQEDMKRQADRRRKESEEWKKEDKVMLSMKDLMFKERLARKLVD